METPETRAFEGYDEFLNEHPYVIQRRMRYTAISSVRALYLNRQRRRLDCEKQNGVNSEQCGAVRRVEGFCLSVFLSPQEALAYSSCVLDSEVQPGEHLSVPEKGE
eukprot:TRINITY_DN28596_c0_g1_i1.p1 TRINITY_DN28596_c0_g1~~TRINITY_DN28596_c0_g1_i1.p1  ORF type:complete len:106 (-),score=16.83 TRINITY_DN28596_c0_g1_i1:65-382(-)